MSEYQPTPKQEQAIREYLHEAVVPLIEDVLVKKLGQAMAFLKEQQNLEQEPVAWRNTETGEFCTGGFLRKDLAKWIPLYTAPPKREWVGLTEEEFFDLLNSKTRFNNVEIPLIADVIRETQAKLKEKNT